LEVVAKAIYQLNFCSGSSMYPATMWIISGLRSPRKMTQLQLRRSSFHKHGSSSGILGFHECGPGSEALFFHGSNSGFSSFSHISRKFHICLRWFRYSPDNVLLCKTKLL